MSRRTDWGYAAARAFQDIMREKGITQQQVADRLGKSQGYVSHRTNGREALTVDIIGAVAELARITPLMLTLDMSERASAALASRPSEPDGDTPTPSYPADPDAS